MAARASGRGRAEAVGHHEPQRRRGGANDRACGYIAARAQDGATGVGDAAGLHGEELDRLVAAQGDTGSPCPYICARGRCCQEA